MSLLTLLSQYCLAEGELRNLAPAVSGNEREQLQTPHGWDTGIMALPGLRSVQALPAVEASFQLWNRWKCSGESWGAEHHTPECWGWWSHQIIACPVVYKLQSQGLATSAQEDYSREVYCTGRALLKDNFLTIVASFIVFSASSACRCSTCKGRCSMAGSMSP